MYVHFAGVLDGILQQVETILGNEVPQLGLGYPGDDSTVLAMIILLYEIVIRCMSEYEFCWMVDCCGLAPEAIEPEPEGPRQECTYDPVLAELNPIRYRGYYYDNETGFYFLQSRYYNPEWRRFLNPDTYFIAGEDALNGSNMYAYCNGNPVMYKDPSGTEPLPDWLKWLIVGIAFPVLFFLSGFEMISHARADPEVNAEFDSQVSKLLNLAISGLGDIFGSVIGFFTNQDFKLPTWDLGKIFAGAVAWFGSLFDKYPFGKKETSYSRKEEHDKDLEMMIACMTKVWEPQYSNLTETTLNSMLDGIKTILNVKSISKITHDPNYVSGEASFDWYGKKEIFVNLNYLDDPKLRSGLIHECRHAYQHEAVEGIGNHIVSDQTKAEWKKCHDRIEAKQYPTPGTDEYYQFTTEFDAYCFENQFQVVFGYTPDWWGSWDPNESVYQ